MGEVKVQRVRSDPLARLTKVLVVSFGVLLGVLVLFVRENPSITGFSVLRGVYGGASSAVIVAVLVLVIVLYLRLEG